MSSTLHFKTLYQYLKVEKKDFWRTNIYGMVATLLLLPIPFIISLLMDELLLHHSTYIQDFILYIFHTKEIWISILMIFTLIFSLRGVAFYFINLKNFYSISLSQKISYKLRRHLLTHLQHVSIEEYETIKSGDISSKMLHDIEFISHFVGQVVVTFLSAVMMIVGIGLIMFWINWIFALLIFTLNPLFFLVSKIIGKKSRDFLLKKNEAYQLYNEFLIEVMELFIQVRASNKENLFFNLLKSRSKKLEIASRDYGYKALEATNISTLFSSVVIDIFRVLGVVVVLYSDLSLGMMLAFLFYLSTLLQPIQQLMSMVVMYQNTKPALARVNTLLTLSLEPSFSTKMNPFRNSKSVAIAFKNISFGYQNRKNVLTNISIKIKEGQKVAFIGKSGSGKTTLAKLLFGFYQPHKGEIFFNTINSKEIGLDVIRENVAFMLQEVLFFNDTLRMNLTLSKPKSEKEIFDALEMAQMRAFVESLEEGLESLMGKNGIRLSGGQRQRLAIARLILSDPKVIIFDEATSALDNETERLLYETLNPFLKDKTTIIIAHRETTIKQADCIYVLEREGITLKDLK